MSTISAQCFPGRVHTGPSVLVQEKAGKRSAGTTAQVAAVQIRNWYQQKPLDTEIRLFQGGSDPAHSELDSY